MKRNLLGVIIPAFNREEFIGPAIESCLSQSEPIREIIVVDNHSTDKTLEIAKRYARNNKNIKVYRNKKNVGMVNNWNTGIKLSKSQYVSLLHSDDLLPPGWSKTISESIKKVKKDKIGLFFGSVASFANGNSNNKNVVRVKQFPKDIILPPKISVVKLWKNFYGNPGNSSAVIYNRLIFSTTGFFDDSCLTEADQDFHLRILNKYSSYFIAKDLVYYRRHAFQAFYQDKHVESATDSANRIKRSVQIQQRHLGGRELIYYSYCGIYLYLLKFMIMFNWKAVKIITQIPNLLNPITIVNFPRFMSMLLARKYFSRFLS